MLMQTMAERSTDRGVEELKERMDERFNLVDARFELVDKRFDGIDAEFRRIDSRFDDVSAEFRRIDSRFENVETDTREIRRGVESMQRNMLYGFFGLGGAILTLAGMIVGFQVF